MTQPDLTKTWVHLGTGGTAIPQPDFDGDVDWFQEYGERTQSDGVEGRLVSMHTFTESWTMWEAHMDGSELVVCTAGTMTLVQEVDGAEIKTTLTEGEYAINQPGVWHTANITNGPASGLFITSAGITEHKPR